MKFHVTLRKPDTVYYTCNDRLSEELVAVWFFLKKYLKGNFYQHMN